MKRADKNLFQAVDDNSPDVAKSAVAEGANLEGRDRDGQTHLMRAIRFGFEPVARTLIELGADVNAVAISRVLDTTHEYYPLFAAVSERLTGLIEPLVLAGAKIDAPNAFTSKTALHSAVATDSLRAMRILLGLGANPNVGNNAGDTALHLAAMRSNLRATKILLARGASIEAINVFGETPLLVAVGRANDTATVEFLISKGANVGHQNNEGKTALESLESVQRNEVSEKMRLLLEVSDESARG